MLFEFGCLGGDIGANGTAGVFKASKLRIVFDDELFVVV